MENTDINSYINLISSILIFIAAVVPVGYAIWSKTEGVQKKAKLKRIVLTSIGLLLSLSSIVALLIFDSMRFALVFFSMYWIFWFILFLIKPSPPSRSEIGILILDSILLSLFILLGVVHWLLIPLIV